MRKPYQVVDIIPKIVAGGVQFFGACIHCGRPASKEAFFQEDGVVVIEKYCDACLQPEHFAILQERYSLIG